MSARLDQLLIDSLALWQVDGKVEPGAAPVAAVINSSACTIWVERAADDAPWRWLVRWRSADMREARARPCVSLVGMLNALRDALGVERGNALRVVAAPAA